MKSSAGLVLKIAPRISELPADHWNKVFPKVVEDYSFFKALDESNFSEFRFFYILVYDNDIPVGATTCFLMDFPLDFAVEGPLKSLMGAFKKLLTPKVLICGMPIGQGRIGIQDDPYKVMNAIQEALDSIAKEQKASIIGFKDFNAFFSDVLDKNLDKSFFRIDSLPTTEMQINFKDFDNYLKSLSSVTRSGIKRKLKKVDQKCEVQLEVKPSLNEEELNAVYGLYLQTYQKNEMSLEKLTLEFFKKMAEYMPHESKFFLWRVNRKIAAFAFCLASEGRFIDYYLGFDYKIAYEYNLYDIRFRDLMTWCIENNMETYEMGPTTYEPKRRLGFNFVWLYIYAKHRSKWLNPFFKWLCRLIQPTNFDPLLKEIKRSGNFT
jgi:hypothetical protein